MKKIFSDIIQWIRTPMFSPEASGYIIMDAEFHEYQCGNFEDDGSYADDDVD